MAINLQTFERTWMEPYGQPLALRIDRKLKAFSVNRDAEPHRSFLVKQFAEKHNVKTKQDDCGDTIISGSAGHIFDNHDGRFGVLVECQSQKQWTHAKKKLIDAGFSISQNGDTEGTALFDPSNGEQTRVAVKLARVPHRRNLSDAQRKAASARMKKAREMKTGLLKTRDSEPKPTDHTNVTPEGHGSDVPWETPSFPLMSLLEVSGLQIEGQKS